MFKCCTSLGFSRILPVIANYQTWDGNSGEFTLWSGEIRNYIVPKKLFPDQLHRALDAGLKGGVLGKSELHRAGRWITSVSDPGKCRRKENAECGPLGPFMAKLKRCGKSAPAAEQSAGLVNPAWSKTE